MPDYAKIVFRAAMGSARMAKREGLTNEQARNAAIRLAGDAYFWGNINVYTYAAISLHVADRFPLDAA